MSEAIAFAIVAVVILGFYWMYKRGKTMQRAASELPHATKVKPRDGASSSSGVCSACSSNSRIAGEVEADQRKFKLCIKCWGQLLTNEIELKKTVAAHKKAGRLPETVGDTCYNCTKILNTTDNRVGVSFERPIRSDDSVLGPIGNRTVFTIFSLCNSCAKNIVPGYRG